MLGTYEAQLSNQQNMAGSFLVSSGMILAIFYTAMLASQNIVIEKERPVEVTFVEQVKTAEPPPPPPPPPPIVKKAPPPPAANPVVPKGLKKIVVTKPVQLKPLAAPKKMIAGPLNEADPSMEKGIAVYAGASEDPAAYGPGGPVQELPETATPPSPRSGNPIPAFPAMAKAEGLSGTVILKIVVNTEGRVDDVQVLRGEDPFVEPAIAAVKGWRYEPAMQNGRPIRVYHIVKIPFTLT